MGETKFTKGNWKIFNERVGVVDKSDSQSHGMMQEVAYVDMYNFGEQEGEANASLIACAPDMYEMLESKLDLIRCGIGANYSGDPKENPKYLEVVELLKRARGE